MIKLRPLRAWAICMICAICLAVGAWLGWQAGRRFPAGSQAEITAKIEPAATSPDTALPAPGEVRVILRESGTITGKGFPVPVQPAAAPAPVQTEQADEVSSALAYTATPPAPAARAGEMTMPAPGVTESTSCAQEGGRAGEEPVPPPPPAARAWAGVINGNQHVIIIDQFTGRILDTTDLELAGQFTAEEIGGELLIVGTLQTEDAIIALNLPATYPALQFEAALWNVGMDIGLRWNFLRRDWGAASALVRAEYRWDDKFGLAYGIGLTMPLF